MNIYKLLLNNTEIDKFHVIAETNRSYIVETTFENMEQSEYAFPKKEVNKTWFWSEKEALERLEKLKLKADKIAELEKEFS